MESKITDFFSQAPKDETVSCFISTRKRLLKSQKEDLEVRTTLKLCNVSLDTPKEPKRRSRRPNNIKVVQPITVSLDTSSSDSDSNTDSVEMLNETVLTHENPTSIVERMVTNHCFFNEYSIITLTLFYCHIRSHISNSETNSYSDHEKNKVADYACHHGI